MPTLEEIKAKQAELEQMITAFQPQSGHCTIKINATISLAVGEHYAGVILNEDGTVAYHLVLLPGAKEDINWNDAKAWASSIGGELPTRREQALLYANCKAQFQSAWYWSSEQHAANAGYAWYQNFGNGHQSFSHKFNQLRACAVRRIYP